MLMILRLNWLMYAKAAALAAFGWLVSTQLEGPSKWAAIAAAALPVFWTASSLAASWWIYDRARIYELGWLHRTPGKWLTLHNGLDGITGTLRSLYPSLEGQTLDIFDPYEMTEPSILEVRRQMNQSTDHQTNWRYLPGANQSYDTVFLVFTAHELRRWESRQRLFLEIQRVLKDDGRIVLVEHLRDWNNFAAFGPGAFHFYSKRAWLASTAPAGLELLEDRRITPFVHALEFGKLCVR